MLPPTRATSLATVETMPARSPPWTVRTYVDPTASCSPSSGTSRTETLSEPSSVMGARDASISAEPASPAQISIIAKLPRSRVIVESSMLRPRPARMRVVSAMMPGRSCPMTVMAWRVTQSSFHAERGGAAEHRVEHGLGELPGEGVLLGRVVAAEQHDLPARRRDDDRLGGVAEPWLGPRHVVPEGAEGAQRRVPPVRAEADHRAQGARH